MVEIFEIIGAMVGIYLFYALLALIFKHKAGIVTIAIFSIGGGLTGAIIQGYWGTLIAAAIAIPIIASWHKVQIRKS